MVLSCTSLNLVLIWKIPCRQLAVVLVAAVVVAGTHGAAITVEWVEVETQEAVITGGPHYSNLGGWWRPVGFGWGLVEAWLKALRASYAESYFRNRFYSVDKYLT